MQVHLVILFLANVVSASVHFMEVDNSIDKRLIVDTKMGSVYGSFLPPFMDANDSAGLDKVDEQYWTRAFRGIPFALPAEGNRRFADAVIFNDFYDYANKSGSSYYTGSPARGNVSIALNATFFNNICTQVFDIDSSREDCLFINVFTPSPSRLTQRSTLLPVVFFIFPGGFWFGDGSFDDMFDPRRIIANKDVIYVTFNHRVSIFGFFYGSFGYTDVRTALKWTKDNIESFGGDPDNISLMGMSSGSNMIAHLLLDVEAPIFQRGILLSPPLILSPKNGRARINQAEILARKAGCLPRNLGFQASSESDNLSDKDRESYIIQCMRKRSARQLLMIGTITLKGSLKTSVDGSPIADTMFWAPVNMPQPLSVMRNPSLAQQERIRSIDLLFGVAKDEIFMFTELLTVGGLFKQFPFFYLRDQNMLQFTLKMMRDALMLPRQKVELLEKSGNLNATSRDITSMTHARASYVGLVTSLFGANISDVDDVLARYPPADDTKTNILTVSHMLTSYGFHCPIRQFMNDFEKFRGKSARIYEFRHVVSYLLPIYGPNGSVFNTTDEVAHATDIPMYFAVSPRMNGTDKVISDWMIDRAVSFAAGTDTLLLNDEMPLRMNDFYAPDPEYHLENGAAITGWTGWPIFRKDAPNWLIIGNGGKISVESGVRQDECDAWDKLGYRF